MLTEEQKQLIQKGAKAFSTMFIALGGFILTIAIGMLSGKLDLDFDWADGTFNSGLVLAIIAGIFFIVFFVSFAIYNSSKGAPELEYLPGNDGLDGPTNINKVASDYGLHKLSVAALILSIILLVPVIVFSFCDDVDADIREAIFGEEYDDYDDEDDDEDDDREHEDSDDDNAFGLFNHSDDEDIEDEYDDYDLDDFEMTPLSDEQVKEVYTIAKLLKSEGYAVYNTLEYSDNNGYASLYVSTTEDNLFKIDLDIDYSDSGLSHVGLSYNYDPDLSEKANFKAANKAFTELGPAIQLLYDNGYIKSDAALNYITFPDEFIDMCLASDEEQTYDVSISETSDAYDDVFYAEYIWGEDDISLCLSFWNI